MAGVRAAKALRHENFNRLAQQFLAFVAEECFGLGIDQYDASLPVDDDYRIRRGLEQAFEKPFGGHVW